MNDSKTSIADLKLGNYTGIRIASIAFLITLLAVVIVSIYLSRSISYDSQAIDIAGRQRMLSQNMSKNIEILSKNEKKYFSKSIQDLKVAYKTFDDTLNGFANGGDTLNTQGGTATLQVVTSPAVREHITQAQAIWAGWKIDIEKVILTSESPDEFSVLIGALEEKVRSQNLELLKLMNSLTVSLKLEARNKSLLQTYISLAALIATIIYFFFIVILSLSNLKRRDQKLLEFSKSIQKNNLDLEQSNLSLITTQNSLEETLETLELSKNDAVSKAQKLEVLTTDLSRLQDESDKIFSTVDHGLCLLKPDLKIGERVSEATYEIFEKKDLTGISFINLMRPLISDKDLSTLTNFLKLQFQGKTLASQLDKFNPLKSVELTLNWDGNTFKNKHVGFEFERIMSGDKVEQVLVTITDITQRVVLERSLEQAEREQAMKSQIIGELMTVDQTEFSRTIVQSERSINEINESLRDKEISGESEIPSELRVKIVNDIFARIHTIKGNASMAGLNQLAERAHSVEEELSTLKNKSSLTGESLLGALVSLSSLRELIDGYRDIKDGFMGKFDPVTVKKAEVSSEESIVKQLSDFGNKIGKEEGKKIQIISNLDFSVLEKKKIDIIKDIYTQLIRNSVIHGIETSDERLRKGKVEEGLIYLSAKLVSVGDESAVSHMKFTFRDDGNGLNLDLIRNKVIDLGIIEEGSPDLENPELLAKMIFTPNFSTKNEVSEHAGRGVGMDVVRSSIVNDLEGKMSMSYSKGNYTEFSWVIPVTPHI